jgi:hypothetical protein
MSACDRISGIRSWSNVSRVAFTMACISGNFPARENFTQNEPTDLDRKMEYASFPLLLGAEKTMREKRIHTFVFETCIEYH